MSRTSQLFDLQQIDSALDSRITRLRQIDVQMADSPELVAARAALAEAEDILAAKQEALKRTSHTAEETSKRLKAQDKRLYDGSIKNPKELSQVQEEVAHLRERLREQEDSAIEAIMEVEAQEEQVDTLRLKLEGVETEWRQFVDGLNEERDKIRAQGKVLKVKRDRTASEIVANDLQLYERLRQMKSRLAIVAVKNGLCDGCHVDIPATILREARASADLTMCPQCSRVLYPAGDIKFRAFDHDLDNINR